MKDWKNDRAEQAMQAADKEMMKKAGEAAKKIEDEKWNLIKQSLYVGDKKTDDDIDWVIDELRKKYELPKAL